MRYSDIHSVGSGDGEVRRVGNADQESVLGDMAHLSCVDCHAKAESATIDGSSVHTVLDGEACYLPLALLLCEVIVGAKRVIRHALLDEILIEVVALRPVQTVHIRKLIKLIL